MLGCVDIGPFRYILRQTDKLPLLPTQVQDAKLLHWAPSKERSEFLISEALHTRPRRQPVPRRRQPLP